MSDPYDLTVFKGPVPKPAKTRGGTGNKKRPDPKRAGRGRWEEIRAKKLGACYVCRWRGQQQRLPSTLHHVVSKSLGGSDTQGNVVPLCGDGTRGHHGDVEAHRADVCRDLAAAIQAWDDLVYSYALKHLGEEGFLRRYKVTFNPIKGVDAA